MPQLQTRQKTEEENLQLTEVWGSVSMKPFNSMMEEIDNINERFRTTMLQPILQVEERLNEMIKAVTILPSFIDAIAKIAVYQEEVVAKIISINTTPFLEVQKNIERIGKQHAFLIRSLAIVKFPICPEGYGSDLNTNLPEPFENRLVYTTEYNTQLLKKILNTQEAMLERKTYDYSHKTRTFIMWTSSWAAINFSTKNDTDNISSLFEIFYEALKERGVHQNGYLSVFITREEILLRATQKGVKNADTDWLKHTKSNLVNLKIPKELRNIVVISNYKQKRKGYEFKIKTGKYLPN